MILVLKNLVKLKTVVIDIDCFPLDDIEEKSVQQVILRYEKLTMVKKPYNSPFVNPNLPTTCKRAAV